MATAEKTTVLDLAIANLAKGEKEIGTDLIKKALKKNKNSWRNDLVTQDELVDSSKDTVKLLASNVNASTKEVCSANEQLATAEADLAMMQEGFESRFGEIAPQ